MEKDDAVISEILVAAKSLFGRFGLKKTTIEDISVAAGKGKSTLYYYFQGKNEIFEAVVKYEMETVLNKLSAAVLTAQPATEKLKIFLITQSVAILELHSLYSVLFDEILDCRNMLRPLRLRYEETQLDMIREIISEGARTGEFKKLSSEHISRLSVIILIAFRGLQFPLTINPDKVRPHEYFNTLIDLVVGGIGI